MQCPMPLDLDVASGHGAEFGGAIITLPYYNKQPVLSRNGGVSGLQDVIIDGRADPRHFR